MLALAVGTLLVVLALAYVLYPLVFATAGAGLRATPRVTAVPAGGDEDAVVALREIEFDRVTGKLSDADYADLKARYTQRESVALAFLTADAHRAGHQLLSEQLRSRTMLVGLVTGLLVFAALVPLTACARQG